MAGGKEQVPHGGDEGRQVCAELLVILLGVHGDVVTDLRLDLLKQTRLLILQKEYCISNCQLIKDGNVNDDDCWGWGRPMLLSEACDIVMIYGNVNGGKVR